MDATKAGTEYAFGHSVDELKRLDQQGALLRPFTQRTLTAAGIGPGMRVLDLGCGTGDVSLLAAEMVGDAGEVIGVDRGEDALSWARDRAALHRLTNCRFVASDLDGFVPDEAVDAIIGRLVLMYLPDPAATIRRLLEFLRPCGVVGFVEVLLPEHIPATVEMPLAFQAQGWLREAFTRVGAKTDMALRQVTALRESGLPNPRLVIEGYPLAGENRPMLAWLAGTVGSLLPVIEKTGVATRESVDIQTLAPRLFAEAADANGVACPLLFGGAWATKPA